MQWSLTKKHIPKTHIKMDFSNLLKYFKWSILHVEITFYLVLLQFFSMLQNWMEEKLLKIIEGAGGAVEGLPNGKQLVMKSTVSRCSVSTTNTSETIILSLIPSYISIFISYRKHQLLQKIEQPWSWPCNSRTCWYQSENVLRMLVGK